MKFTTRKQDVQQELALMLGIVEAKATIPVLSHLLLQAGRDGLDLFATDLDIGLRARCAGDVSSAGAVVVPARKLHDVVRALDCDVISFEAEENHRIRIDGGSFRGRLVGLPDGEFPPEPTFPSEGSSVRVPLATLQSMISRSLFAVASENTRFSLNGALLCVAGGTLLIVATDGHRLAVVQHELGGSAGRGDFSALVPRKALAGIGRMPCVDENEEVEVAIAENHAFFRTARRTISSRLLEGSFPAWEKVIPADNDHVVTVSRTALAGLLTRTALLTSDTSRLITLGVDGPTLMVTAANPALGEASETLAVDHAGGEVRIGLNCEYLLQFLQASSGERVELRLKNAATQALLTAQGDGPWTNRYVVMPMRLS